MKPSSVIIKQVLDVQEKAKTPTQGVFIKNLQYLADPTGFEPAISALTGPHVWPLHHGSSCGL
jgi:hypothetical protein